MIIYDTYNDEEDKLFLTPSQKVLFDFGELYPYYMKDQLWRFIMPIFLHANLIHLLSSILILIYVLSFIESQLGKAKTLILFFIGSIGGVSFNALISDEAGVCGSIPIGVISFSQYLEYVIFKPRSSVFSFF